jgi:hypothetical protein
MAELRDQRSPGVPDPTRAARVGAGPCKTTLAQASASERTSCFDEAPPSEAAPRSTTETAKWSWPADTMRELLGADAFDDGPNAAGSSALTVGAEGDAADSQTAVPDPRSSMEMAPPSTSTANASLDVFFDLSSQIRSPAPKPNAFMMVRAVGGKNAELLDLWQGVAFYTGELPASFQATRSQGKWHWSQDGAPTPGASALKLDSDASGRSGRLVTQWAPKTAAIITVDFVPLSQPFGSEPAQPNGRASPSGALAPFAGREASGSEAMRGAEAGALEGPSSGEKFREQGRLVIFDAHDGSTISLGKSYVRIYGKPQEYLYRVLSQTSLHQRVVQVTATSDVYIESHQDPTEEVELLHLLRRAPLSELVVLRSAEEDAPAVLSVPEISASGDRWRVALRMGKSAIHITALSAEARFAYFVDPCWSGNVRAVHIVATPGVRVDEAASTPLLDLEDHRVLVANSIYVQDPSLVPQQGEPIDPSRYLALRRFDNLPVGLTPVPTNTSAFTVATGGSSLTVRDLESGAVLTIRAVDPSLGARFLHRVNGDEVLALVSKETRIEVTQPSPRGDEELEGPAPLDFRQVRFALYQVDQEGNFPRPDEPLTREVLERYGRRREPDVVRWGRVDKSEEQQAAELLLDLGLGFLPWSGDVLDIVDARAALVRGTDKWGNPLSTGERLAVLLAALLPLVTTSAVLAGRTAARGLRAARATKILSFAERMGRTDAEVQALLAQLRRIPGEGWATARRIEQAVAVGADVDPADLVSLEKHLSHAGFRGLVAAGPPRSRAPDIAGAVDSGAASRPAEHLFVSESLRDKERELRRAVVRYARRFGIPNAAARVRIEIVPARAFAARFGSEQARAVFQPTRHGPVIFARADAKTIDMADEVAHLAQLRDPVISPAIHLLDESGLERWHELSPSDRFELYQRKLTIEIDAKRRTLGVVRSRSDRAIATAALDDLLERQTEVSRVGPAELARMNAGLAELPEFLNQPPYIFGKQRRVRDAAPPTATARGRRTSEATQRLTSRSPDAADYSSAYARDDVSSVFQVGSNWKESTIVTADVTGKIVAREVAPDGTISIRISDGRADHVHVLEAGSTLEKGMVPGRKVQAGQRLGVESSREYREVSVLLTDGSSFTREEIRSNVEGRRWIQRGSESTARGRAAEAVARSEADADISARIGQKEIRSAFHVSHSLGGGGFDDVIIECGDSGAVRVRIREVKDHANRHPSLQDFSAINENFERNLGELKRRLERDLVRAGGLGQTETRTSMTADQLLAALNVLDTRQIEIEIVLGKTTMIGAEGHYASRVLPALKRRHPKLTVLRLGAIQ